MTVSSLAIAAIAFRFHPVGDYFTESDFYAGYSIGARALQGGDFDPGRYGVYGPAYELILAAVGLLLGDLFLSARAISVASAIVVLAGVWRLGDLWFGPRSATWLVAFVAVNPTFVRYGYSATTDMLSFAFFVTALVALYSRAGPASVVSAGLAAALATLTRYNLASLVPGAIAVWLARRPRGTGLRGSAAFVIVFLVAIAPFAIAAAGSGHVPGATLFRDSRFYLGDAPATALEERYGEPGMESPQGRGGAVALLARRAATGLFTHARDDARVLLGWPAAILVLASLAWLLVHRGARPLLPLLLPFAFVFLALAPVFHSERYSMVLLPFYFAPVALALGQVGERGGWIRALAPVAGALVLMTAGRDCVALQRLEYASLPIETLAAGRAIAAEAVPGERVLARKAHVAYASGLEPVLFPDVQTLAELGEVCRKEGVSYLYYSWYEVRLRPRFGFLLDTTAAVPGLEPIHATREKPSATYRVGPELGATPVWWEDEARREAIARRVNALLEPSRAD